MAKKKSAPAPAAAPAAAALRNRIVGHRHVRAADLLPHPLNPRTHGSSQREALRAMLASIGLARSTLAYVADAHKHAGESAPLTLIDGHLRRETLGDEIVVVEVLDVSDEEAKMLLLTMDPLASLAGYDEERLASLRSAVTTDCDALNNLWGNIADAQKASERILNQAAEKRRAAEKNEAEPKLIEKYLVIIECADEAQQGEILRLASESGWKCKAVMS
jgi:hypothetical protein